MAVWLCGFGVLGLERARALEKVNMKINACPGQLLDKGILSKYKILPEKLLCNIAAARLLYMWRSQSRLPSPEAAQPV